MSNRDTYQIPSLGEVQAQYVKGAIPQAVEMLRRIEASKGRSFDSALLLGACLGRLKQSEEATAVLEEVVALDENCFDALTWLATLKKKRDTVDEALQYAERAIKIRPDLAAGYSALGGCLLYMRKPQDAVDAFKKAVEISPSLAENRHNLGLAYQMLHRHQEAVEQFAAAVSIAPRAVQTYIVLANEYSRYGDVWKSIDVLTRGIRQQPDSYLLHSSLATAYSTVRENDLAEKHFVRSLELSPEGRAPYASWLINLGRFHEAEEIYTAMSSESTNRCLALYGILQCRKITADDAEILNDMSNELTRPGLTIVDETYLRFALGKAQEQLGEFREAMENFDEANRLAYQLHNAGNPFDTSELRRTHAATIRYYEQIPEVPQNADTEISPIFVVGMIRSGTTLLEQVIASHPEVSPAGELRFWIEKTAALVSGGIRPTAGEIQKAAKEYREYSLRFTGFHGKTTDKMPLNFACLGIIHRAMPRAKIVHIRRNPVDTCLSIYTTYFGKGPEFAYDKANIVSYFKAYVEIMDYWRTNLSPDCLLEVRYEDLVNEPNSVIPAIVKFCDLPWDAACLRQERQQQLINTPSRWQARQPIYRTSVERWRNYEPWLGEFSKLKPDRYDMMN